MASASRPPDLIERIIEYSRKTQISFKLTPRWYRVPFRTKRYPVPRFPDLRGFCPHLRRVNLYKDQEKLGSLVGLERGALNEIGSGKAGQALWVLHDILHIAFYDFATLNLGSKSWQNKERFLENHLASELFSVLALDYFYLVFTKVKGLAVHLDAKTWKSFQNINPFLPDLGSFEFCKGLFDLYFTGRSQWLYSQSESKAPAKVYDTWIGHEARYASKQRYYVLLWWNDLKGKKGTDQEAIISGSEVHHAVWELLGIFLSSSKKDWEEYLNKVTCRTRPKNVFSQIEKYKRRRRDFDFRFTDIQAFTKKEILNFVSQVKGPTSSHLFLFWQILSTLEPENFDQLTLRRVSELAGLSNSSANSLASSSRPLEEAWEYVRGIVLDAVRGPHFDPGPKDSLSLSTFFLP